MNTSDVTILQYHSGQFSGRVALFFESDRAKLAYDRISPNEKLYCIVSNVDADALNKAQKFCATRQLRYEVVVRN